MLASAVITTFVILSFSPPNGKLGYGVFFSDLKTDVMHGVPPTSERYINKTAFYGKAEITYNNSYGFAFVYNSQGTKLNTDRAYPALPRVCVPWDAAKLRLDIIISKYGFLENNDIAEVDIQLKKKIGKLREEISIKGKKVIISRGYEECFEISHVEM